MLLLCRSTLKIEDLPHSGLGGFFWGLVCLFLSWVIFSRGIGFFLFCLFFGRVGVFLVGFSLFWFFFQVGMGRGLLVLVVKVFCFDLGFVCFMGLGFLWVFGGFCLGFGFVF